MQPKLRSAQINVRHASSCFVICCQVAFGKRNYGKLHAQLVFEDEPSSDETARVDVSRTRGNRRETIKVDVPRTYEGGVEEPGRKVSSGNTAYGPVHARLQFTNPSHPPIMPYTGQRPFNGYQQPPINYAQGSFQQPTWGQGGFPQGGMPPQGGYFQQPPMNMPQYGRPAVHWPQGVPQGRPFDGGVPGYGAQGFRVTAGGQPMINPGAYSPPPAWNGQYQVFNSRTPQYPLPGRQGGYPNPNGAPQTSIPVSGAQGSFPSSGSNPEGWETAAVSSGNQPTSIIPQPDGPIQYFDHRGRRVDEPAVPDEVFNPQPSSGQDAPIPANRPAAVGQPNQVYQQARQPSPGYQVGACTGGACAQPAVQQGFGQPLSGANGGPCLNDGCGVQGGQPGGQPLPGANGGPCLNDGCGVPNGMPGGMPQMPFPANPPCVGGGCGVGAGVPVAPFRMGEPCLNEGCGMGGGFPLPGGGFPQPCSNGPCSRGTTIMQETIVDAQASPCLGNGCMQSGGFPPQGFRGGPPMMNQPPCPAGQMWMVANTGYG